MVLYSVAIEIMVGGYLACIYFSNPDMELTGVLRSIGSQCIVKHVYCVCVFVYRPHQDHLLNNSMTKM